MSTLSKKLPSRAFCPILLSVKCDQGRPIISRTEETLHVEDNDCNEMHVFNMKSSVPRIFQ